jgi:hypothetical protein
MTPDEQEFRSIHYLYRGYRFVPLTSGRIAVAEALPSTTLIQIVDTPEEALALLLSYQPSKGATHDYRKDLPDLSSEEFGGIGISLF